MKHNDMLARVFKADASSTDLASGGALRDDIAVRYIETPFKESAMLSEIRVEPMRSGTKHLPKVIFASDVAKPGTEGVALPLASRSKLTHSEVVLQVVEVKAEVRYSTQYVEDSIASGNFEDVLMRLFRSKFRAGMENLAINGDTGSATPLLALQNGWLARATAVTYAHGTANPDKSLFSEAIRAMESEFIGDLSGLRHYMGTHGKLLYIEEVADRMTGLGDEYFRGQAVVTGMGVPVVGVPLFPQDQGSGSNETSCLTTMPENLIVGFFPDQMTVKMDEDISSGKTLIVARTRMGVQIEETSAVTKSTGILAA